MIRHKIHQSDLAAMAGVACENVSRVFSDWTRRKVMTGSSGYYCLNDIATLNAAWIPSALPGEWNHFAEKETRQINILEQILVAKVFNFGGICSRGLP